MKRQHQSADIRSFFKKRVKEDCGKCGRLFKRKIVQIQYPSLLSNAVHHFTKHFYSFETVCHPTSKFLCM